MEHTRGVTAGLASRWRAGLVGGLGAGLLATWFILVPQVAVPADDVGWYVVGVMTPCLLVSMLLVARMPRAAVTRVVTIMTLCHLALAANDAVRWWRAAHGGPPYNHMDSSVWGGIIWLGTLPLLPILLVVFPDGVPRNGVWRTVFRAQIIALATLVLVVVAQTVDAPASWAFPLAVAAGGVLVTSGVVRGATLVRLWWHSYGERRKQLRPFVIVAGLLAALYGVGGLHLAVTGHGWSPGNAAVNGLMYAFTIGGLPIALGLSVLQHRLYGIEVVVNRVAVAALVSVMLSGVYGAIVVAASAAAGGGGFQWPSLLAAGVTVAALAPLYRLVSAGVDRIMFGDRDRPDRVLQRLARLLGETVDPLEVPQTVVATVGEALRLPFVALDLKVPTGVLRAASRGREPAAQRLVTYPIAYGGHPLGELVVAPRAGEDMLGETDRRVLTDLAAQAGPGLYAGRLITELGESRERLRRGRLDERARLRRALHDGISPTLSGIAMAAAAARGREPGDPAVGSLLRRIEEEAGTGATTLSALLAGLRPPGLEELGLVGAIEERASELAEATGLTVDIRSDGPLPALDPDVEQAAFLITIEAMANVARHAAATHCDVSLANGEGFLHLTVTDDGRGMPSVPRQGHGLRSARERAVASGGVLTVQTAPGGGVQLKVRLPAWAGS